MMKIVLFALVCVSFSQAYSSGVEKEIKEAIDHITRVKGDVTTNINGVQRNFNEVKSKFSLRTDAVARQQNEFQLESISLVKNKSQEFIRIAKEDKLPESVIKCISKEEATATENIKKITTNYQTELKKILTAKLAIHTQIEKEIQRVNKSLSETYTKGVADLKKCTDGAGVNKTVNYIESKMIDILFESNEIDADMRSNYVNFEKEIITLTLNANGFILTTRTLAIKKMKDCLKKTAQISSTTNQFLR